MIAGKLEKTVETVLNAFDNGIQTVLIANITNLSEIEVMKILKTNKRLE